ncbi:hypothetical protein P0O24_03110 [Methanotrichaceae archaeon M04Ac]|uniref:Uncharacterized protein n=1 Tax=Candidatus Methanocrinis alkalitolerans TaxID=3033395 RepID=A0ABT5XD34_9EURY|nr:hypothetical protein [Candidatus Methanocrinis alkalitolerans]MDF0592570.1 hypothetical protein [Candidatus Methanocrinis alkalitolerans]
MREDEKFQIIWENAQRMPEMEKLMFYELERKKLVAGFLLAAFFFAGAGLIYAGKAVKGTILILADLALLAVFFSLLGFGPYGSAEAVGVAKFVPLPLILALYAYAIWDARRTIEDYNKRLYLTVFDRYPP